MKKARIITLVVVSVLIICSFNVIATEVSSGEMPQNVVSTAGS